VKTLPLVAIAALFLAVELSHAAQTVPPPVITSVSPTLGPPFTQVTILGSGFGITPGFITFNGAPGRVVSWSATKIVVRAPDGLAGSGPLKVNGKSNGVTFSFTPTIVALLPSTVKPGWTFSIIGENFGLSPGNATLNGSKLATTFWGNFLILAKVPAAATTGPVVVTTSIGASNARTLRVQGGPSPLIIVATATPPPNANGWNNTNVTVMFSCNGGVAPVQCPAAQTVTTDGAGQKITGTATDASGATATTSVTVSVDKTLPTITAAVTPTPNANGWNNSDVIVTFACNDSLSGMASCPPVRTASTDGENQSILGTATDKAGNTATASVTVNLDKTPPSLAITSPVSGSTVSSSTGTIRVNGSEGDALSGVASVKCNGAMADISGANFACTLSLSEGFNSIPIEATDIAGNTTTITLTLTVIVNPPAAPGIPVVNPGAITASVPATVTISTLVTGGSGGRGAPTSVFLEQVDAGGNLLATLGTLNDAGMNGDLYAGDQIFTGRFTFNVAPGTVWLRVSIAFTEISNLGRSGVTPLEVLPAGVPLAPQYFPNSQAVSDTNGREMPCDQVLALFMPGTSVAGITTLASGIGGVVVGFVPGAQLHTWQIQIPCTSAQGVQNAVNTLMASSLVIGAEPNYLVHTAGLVPNDPGFVPCQWGTALPDGRYCSTNSNAPELMLIRADAAWAITQGLSPTSDLGIPYPGPVIGIIDSGVDYTQEDLAGPGKVIKGRNFIDNTSDPMDDYGHGTGVAGVAAADGNNGLGIPGMSWASPIVAEKVVAANGFVNVALVPAAINDALSRGAKIINLSLGGPRLQDTDVLASALDTANKAGALVVAAAGNDYCSQRIYPAGFSQQTILNGITYDTTVLSVGGIDLDSAVATTSTPSTCQPDNGSNFGSWVDLYAPWYAYTTQAHQCNLPACNVGERYSLAEGTSYAAPYVSGAAALVWAANPQASASDVMRTLLATAHAGALDPLGNRTKILNVLSAVFQAAATHCKACPETPEVTVGPSTIFTGPMVTVGVARGPNDFQNSSVHGVSLPLTPIVGASSTAPTGRTITVPLGYQVWVGYYLVTWDSYTCCSPRSATGKGLFDSFSVSTSVVPYWQLGLQDPISLFSIPSQVPLSALLPSPGQPHACEATAIPLSSPVCSFNAGLVFGGQSQGTQLQWLDSSLAGAKFSLPAGINLFNVNTWLNFVLDTASSPDSDNQFPSYGFFHILDITPLCLDNQNPAGPLLAGICVPN